MHFSFPDFLHFKDEIQTRTESRGSHCKDASKLNISFLWGTSAAKYWKMAENDVVTAVKI